MRSTGELSLVTILLDYLIADKEKSGVRSRKCVGNSENDGCFAGGKGGPETGLP